MANPSVIINSVTYQSVPEVDIPKSGGGTAKFYYTGDADAAAGNILSGKKAFGASGEIEGSMANNGSTSGTISTKAGTYKCAWSMDRNTTSGTNGSQLYKNGSAVGSAHTTWTHNGASCEETLTLAKNDVLVVRARSRNTSYYVGVSNLICIEQ